MVLGVVQSVKPYGAFIDIGGVTGLLHVSQISHERIMNVDKYLSEGDKLKVSISRGGSSGQVAGCRAARRAARRAVRAVQRSWVLQGGPAHACYVPAAAAAAQVSQELGLWQCYTTILLAGSRPQLATRSAGIGDAAQ